MKTIEPPLTTFIGYVKFIQQELGRKLTEKEMKGCLQMYIKPITVEQALEELKK